MKWAIPNWQRVRLVHVCPAIVAIAIAVAQGLTTASPPSAAGAGPDASSANSVEAIGRTQCILTRRFAIAPVPLHPVTAVLVEPGSRVKKGQPLVKLDDDEPQADVRARAAAVETAQIALKEARRYLTTIEVFHLRGSTSEQSFHEASVAALKAERDERAAQAALDSAKAELEHYQVTAEIDGVVSWLKVWPGLVSRPGTTIWGEILDLHEIDVCCELTLEQVDRVSIGQAVEVRRRGKKDMFGTGRVTFVGIATDPKTETVPVHARLANPDLRLRCDEPVQLRFVEGMATVGGGR